MSISKSNNGIAAWLDDFIVAFKSKNEVKAENEITADINVRDLPKVVWNDETFYVLFDNDCAQILNQFANVVTTLKDVSTIEEVDNALNSKQVIAQNEETNMFEEEISKVSSYLEDIETMEMTAEETISAECDCSENEITAEEVVEAEEIVETVEASEEVNNENISLAQYEDLKNEIENLRKEKEKMANQILEMNSQIESLIQNYARIDPGHIYDLNVREKEVEHFEQSSMETETQIENESNVDLTTPEGRVNYKNEEANEELVENLINDVDSYLSLEEEIEIVEEDTAEEVEIAVEDITEETTEEVIEETTEETVEEVVEDELNEEVELTEEEVGEVVIEELTAEQGDKFRQKVCPICDDTNLVMASTSANIVGITCKKCQNEYAVNTDNDTIFIKK